MNKFTKTIKTVIAGATFAAAATVAMVSTSANASISLHEDYIHVNSWAKVEAFCGNASITCTSISGNDATGYVVYYY